VAGIDYDFGKLKVTRQDAMSIAIRVKYVDRAASEALASVPGATVLHLGAGLDTRAFRLDRDARFEWYDVDFPEVVELRRSLVPERDRLHLIGSSVTDLEWLDEVPSDRPVVVVAEGLMQYLSKDDFVQLLSAVVERFPRGQVVLDSWNTFASRVGKFQRAIKATGARTGGWGIDDPRDLETWIPGLTLVAARGYFDLPELTRASVGVRAAVRVMRLVPVLRDMGLMLRYRF